MKNTRWLRLLAPFAVFLSLSQLGCRGDGLRERPIRIACVGDSVTFGTNIAGRRANCWPARLQALLGKGYRVGNFGVPGATLRKDGRFPYTSSRKCRKALAFQPHVVIISLGLNDSDPPGRPHHGKEFIADYLRLAGAFRERSRGEVRIFICKLTPVFGEHLLAAAGIADAYRRIQEQIERVAETGHFPLIDLHAPLRSRADLFPDALHPNVGGARIIARTVYEALQREGVARR
ncbi:MAG: hypothetical protein JXO51_06425 [Candidatus Aminicenantes bacterium]|nr:hypothetical protein [Candidatus Aminicenantes bacterium]